MKLPIINIFHVIFVAPLLIYLGYNKKETSDLVFNAVLILGIMVLLTHLYLTIKKIRNPKK
jgi:hypothetical protein